MASDEKKQLELLDRVEIRILQVSNHDQKFGDILGRYLRAYLDKAASEHSAVREQVIKFASTLRRLCTPPSITIPVKALLEQYKATQSPIVRMLDLSFIQLGFPRLSQRERAELVPIILQGLGSQWHPPETNPSGEYLAPTYEGNLSTLFNIFLHLLPDITIPGRETAAAAEFRPKIGLDDEADRTFLAYHIGELMLFRPPVPTVQDQSPHYRPDIRPSTNAPPAPAPTPSPLFSETTQFFTLGKPSTWASVGGTSDSLNLAQIRKTLIGLLASAAFTDYDQLLPAIYASSVQHAFVRDTAAEILKRSGLPFADPQRDPSLIPTLLTALRRRHLPAASRTTVINLLAKGSLFPETEFAAVVDGLIRETFPAATSSAGSGRGTGVPVDRGQGLERKRLNAASVALLHRALRDEPDGKGRLVSPSHVVHLRAYLSDTPISAADDPDSLRPQAYALLAVLCRKTVLTPSQRLEVVAWLFDRVKTEKDPEVARSVEAALAGAMTAGAFEGDEEVENEIAALLTREMDAALSGEGSQSGMRDSGTTDGFDSTAQTTVPVASLLRWANAVLPFANARARYLGILAQSINSVTSTGEVRDEDVLREAEAGLDPYLASLRPGKQNLPDVGDLVEQFFATPILSSESGEVHTWHVSDRVITAADLQTTFTNFRGRRDIALPKAAAYAMDILRLSTLKDRIGVTQSWKGNLDRELAASKELRDTLRESLENTPLSSGSLRLLLGALLAGVLHEWDDSHDAGTVRASVELCARAFLDLARMLPHEAIGPFSPLAINVVRVLREDGKARCPSLATVVGVLAAHPSNSTSSLAATVTELEAGLKDWGAAGMNYTQDACLASLVCIRTRRIYYGQKPLALGNQVLDMVFAELIEGKSAPSRLPAVLRALSEVLTAEFTQDADDSDAGALASLGPKNELATRLKQLVEENSTANNAQKLEVAQLAAGCLGGLTMRYSEDGDLVLEKSKQEESEGDDGAMEVDSASTKEVTTESSATSIASIAVNAFLALYKIEDTRLLLRIGDALAIAVAGWDAMAIDLGHDIQPVDAVALSAPRLRAQNFNKVLDALIKYSESTEPKRKLSTSVWIYSLLRNLGALPALQDRFVECQTALVNVLAKCNNGYVHDISASGLALIQENSPSEASKLRLAKELIKLFGDKQRRKDFGKVAGGEDLKPRYERLTKLAVDAGDETLVYRFILLAGNLGDWSKAGAGEGRVLGRGDGSDVAQAGASAQKEVNPKLYVKLFRYRFDPNPGVRRTMENIWKSVTAGPGSREVVDAHFDAIVEDLLAEMHSPTPSTRLACAGALAEILGAQYHARLAPYAAVLWEKVLRLLDDSSEEMIILAVRLTSGLGQALSKPLETNAHNRVALEALDAALPVLISDRGMDHSSQLVRIASAATVYRLCGELAGSVLAPHVMALIPALLNSLSTLDDDGGGKLNRARLLAGDDDEARRDIDRLHSTGVARSGAMKAVEDLLRHLGGSNSAGDTAITDGGQAPTRKASSFGEVVAVVSRVANEAVAVKTRIGAAKVLASLFRRTTPEAEKAAMGVLKGVMAKRMFGGHEGVAGEFRLAAVYVLRRVRTEEAAKWLAGLVTGSYAASEEPRKRAEVTDLFLKLKEKSQDVWDAVEGVGLPFLLVARGDEGVRERLSGEGGGAASDILEDEAVGIAARRYLGECLGLVWDREKLLESPFHAVRNAAAMAVGDVAGVLAAQAGTLGSEPLLKVWPAFEKALALKSFKGKEKLLAELPGYVKARMEKGAADEEWKGAIRKVVKREAGRENAAKEFRDAARKCKEDVESVLDAGERGSGS